MRLLPLTPPLPRCTFCSMFGRLENYIRGSLDDLLPHDAAERCSGRVGIVLTRVWPRISKVGPSDQHITHHAAALEQQLWVFFCFGRTVGH